MKAHVHASLTLAAALASSVALDLFDPDVEVRMTPWVEAQPQPGPSSPSPRPSNPSPRPKDPSPKPSNPQPDPASPAPAPGTPQPNPQQPSPAQPNQPGTVQPGAPAAPATTVPPQPTDRRGIGQGANPRFFQFADANMQTRFHESSQRLAAAEQRMQQRNQELLRRLGEIRQMTGEKRMDALSDLMQDTMRENAALQQHLIQMRTMMTGDLEMASSDGTPAPSGTPTTPAPPRPGETPPPR